MFYFIILSLLSIESFTVSFSQSLSNVTDQTALLDFMNQLSNNTNNVLTNNWTLDTSFCNWIGVTCSTQRQRVTSLNLQNSNLEGTISPSIANLSFLAELDLSNNNLHGSLPFELSRLSRLRTINVSSNHFTDSIPSSFFNMSSLRALYLSNNRLSGSFLLNGDDSLPLRLLEIDLSYNNLTGEFPSSLCRFPELISLDLSYNNLTGQIPRNIDCLSSLESLYMTDNNVGGTIPPGLGNISSLQYIGCVENSIIGNIPHELGNLRNLRMLGFDFNNLTGGIPPAIFNLSSLVNIAFTDNNLSGHVPTTLGLHLPNLEGIFLADNLLEGEFPVSISNATRLRELELSYNFFVGSVPNNLGNLRELVFLNIAGNRLSGNQELGFINSLVECRMLQFVILGNNPLNGFLPDSVQNLSSTIEMFNIEDAQVYGEIPRGVGNMSNMISLILDGNNLTGNIPSEIGSLTRLQRLYLNRNRLEGSVPSEICNLVELGDIILSENILSGTIPECIGNLGRLQRLMLGYNSFTSTLPSSLWVIRGLLLINITRNHIQGELPRELGVLDNIEGIDLSSNQISGPIPNAMGELANLRYLFLSNNSFDGSIPTSFGNLISLEILDLSSNNLSGTIPTSLESLLYLSEINVSYNHLQGQVPIGGVFSNSSRQSFEGNHDLCGMPYLEVPLCTTRSSTGSSRSRRRILRISIPIAASVALIIVLFSLWLLRKRKRAKLEDHENKQTDIPTHQTISYHELLNATGSFSEANLIGVGGSGSVYKGILSDGTIVAVKVLNIKAEESRKRFDAECEVLKELRHRNLVKVITTCTNDYWRSIVLQYMPNGSLENLLYKQENVLDLLKRIEIILDVARAIEYLHHGYHQSVVHCDLKPGNVLLDAEMVAHVSDFGISKILNQDSSSAQTKTLGTIGYIAPEYGSKGIVSTTGDVYSFGIMLIEVLTRKRPTDEMFNDNLSLRQWVKEAFPNSLSDVIDTNLLFQWEDELDNDRRSVCISSAIELALECSKEAPDERINMNEAAIRLVKIKERFLDTKEKK